MKLFGQLSELTKLIYRKSTRAITVEPTTQTVGDATLTIPDLAGTGRTVVTDTNSQTLTNKTLTSPSINGGTLSGVAIINSTISLDDSDSANKLTLQSTSTLTADRTLTFDSEDGDRTLRLAGNLITSGSSSLTLTTTGATNVTLPTTGTLATLAGAEALTNKTQISVDNINLDLNTISSTSGNLILDATGSIYLNDVTELRSGADLILNDDTNTRAVTVAVPASLANNRTWTFPDADNASPSFVGTNATQTITNKNLASSTNTLTGATASSLTNSGTVTIPSGTDTLVARTSTDTLTNKTLTSPAINTPNLDGGTASATSRVVVSKETITNLTALTRKQAAIYYDTTNNSFVGDNGTSLTAFASGGVATPTVSGTVTSYFPTIQSAVLISASTTINITTTDGYQDILASHTSSQTINLPAASANTGRILSIVKTNSGGTVTVDANSSETIDGSTTQALYFQYGKMTIVCDGTGWYSVTPIIEYGQYTPTDGGVARTNLTTAPTFNSSTSFTRIGNRVTVAGAVSINPNGSGIDAGYNFTRFRMTLPIASNFTDDLDLAGTIVGSVASGGDVYQAGKITSDSTNDVADVQFNTRDADNNDFRFMFQYIIK